MIFNFTNEYNVNQIIKTLFVKFINFYLYSSIHISLGAVALVFSIAIISKQNISANYYGFVFCSTLFIYGLHRIIGIQKTYSLNRKGRYNIVKQYKSHIQLYTLLGGLGSVFLFFSLDRFVQFLCIVPGIISLLYTLPVFGQGKRLRDLHYIKIFLIAAVWAVSTAFIPARIVDTSLLISTCMTIERFCFFMAITIPFDIRDMTIDMQINVKTIVHQLGKQRSIHLALFFLLLSISSVYYLHELGVMPISHVLALGLSYAITGFLIFRFSSKESDYYFTGLLDGTMILLALSVWIAQLISI